MTKTGTQRRKGLRKSNYVNDDCSISKLLCFSATIGNFMTYENQVDFQFKDVRGWQFLIMKVAETLCIVCLPPEEHIS